MNEEKLMILKMLEDGKISAEDAENLLSALGEPKREVKDKLGNFTEKTMDYSEKAASRGLSLAENIMEGFSGLFESIEDSNFSNIFSGKYESEFYDFKFDTSGKDKLNIDVLGVNDTIRIYPTEGSEIAVNANVRYGKTALKNRPKEGYYDMAVEGTTIFLRPLFKENIAVKLDIYLPRASYGQIKIENRNAKVEIDNLMADKLEIKSKNASINLNNIDAGFILLETRNGKLELHSVKSEETNLHSTNGKIILESVNSKKLNVTTSNSLIDAEDLTSLKAFLTTSNGSINIRTADDFSGYLNLRSSSGNVNINIDDLVFDIDSKNIKVARTLDCDSDNPREIVASTSNGNISVA